MDAKTFSAETIQAAFKTEYVHACVQLLWGCDIQDDTTRIVANAERATLGRALGAIIGTQDAADLCKTWAAESRAEYTKKYGKK